MSKENNKKNYTIEIINHPSKEHIIEKTKELSKFLSEILPAKINQNKH